MWYVFGFKKIIVKKEQVFGPKMVEQCSRIWMCRKTTFSKCTNRWARSNAMQCHYKCHNFFHHIYDICRWSRLKQIFIDKTYQYLSQCFLFCIYLMWNIKFGFCPSKCFTEFNSNQYLSCGLLSSKGIERYLSI